MTFEAAIQVLKAFLSNCNFKDHLKRIAVMWGFFTALHLEEVFNNVAPVDMPTYVHPPSPGSHAPVP